MPDLDIVERKIAQWWRPAYRLLKGGQPREIVAAALVKALAAELRASKGIPRLQEFSAALEQRPDLARLSEVARELERKFEAGEYRVGQNLARAARAEGVRVALGSSLPSREKLAKEHCWQLCRHYLFGRVEPTLVGSGRPFPNTAELRVYEERCREVMEPDLDGLVKRLARHPDGQKLRAPAVRRRKRSTAELIDAPLVGA